MTAVVKESTALTERPTVSTIVRPVVTPVAMIEAQEELAQLIHKALKEGVDYGKIPGTKENTLFKAGAERLIKAYGCVAEYPEIIADIDHDRIVNWSKKKKVYRNRTREDKSFDWTEEVGTSLGLYSFRVRCRIVRASDGLVIGEGWGSCSTMESKYIDRPRECENTALKMAQKRGMVAGVLNAFALSDRFTQDMEDEAGESREAEVQVEAPKEEKDRIYAAAKLAGITTRVAMETFTIETLGTTFIGAGKDVDTLLKAIVARQAANGEAARNGTSKPAEKPGVTFDDEPAGGAK
jgi:hypothetical protein